MDLLNGATTQSPSSTPISPPRTVAALPAHETGKLPILQQDSQDRWITGTGQKFHDPVTAAEYEMSVTGRRREREAIEGLQQQQFREDYLSLYPEIPRDLREFLIQNRNGAALNFLESLLLDKKSLVDRHKEP